MSYVVMWSEKLALVYEVVNSGSVLCCSVRDFRFLMLCVGRFVLLGLCCDVVYFCGLVMFVKFCDVAGICDVIVFLPKNGSWPPPLPPFSHILAFNL